MQPTLSFSISSLDPLKVFPLSNDFNLVNYFRISFHSCHSSLVWQVRDLILKFVICTNSPFRIVENKEFSDLISYVSSGNAHLPTTKTLISDLEKKYEKLKSLLIERIDKAKYVCLTADGWSNKGRSFLGITIHMFDDELNKHSFLLSFRRMFGRHTHEAIKEHLLLIIHEFNIKLSKITHIVTDGARNFQKAFKV